MDVPVVPVRNPTFFCISFFTQEIPVAAGILAGFFYIKYKGLDNFHLRSRHYFLNTTQCIISSYSVIISSYKLFKIKKYCDWNLIAPNHMVERSEIVHGWGLREGTQNSCKNNSDGALFSCSCALDRIRQEKYCYQRFLTGFPSL